MFSGKISARKQKKLDKELGHQVYLERPSAVQSLLEKGANPNAYKNERPVIIEAIRWSDLKTMNVLITAGASLKDPENKFKVLSFININSANAPEILDHCLKHIDNNALQNYSANDLLGLYSVYEDSDCKNAQRILEHIKRADLTIEALGKCGYTSEKQFKRTINHLDFTKIPNEDIKSYLLERVGHDSYNSFLKIIAKKIGDMDYFVKDLREKALEENASENLQFLSQYSQAEWVFDGVYESQILRMNYSIPTMTIQEVFNFKGQTGERFSKLEDNQTKQKTLQRESFSQIDDQDLIIEAARQLESRGGKLPENSQYRLKRPSVLPKACA